MGISLLLVVGSFCNHISHYVMGRDPCYDGVSAPSSFQSFKDIKRASKNTLSSSDC